MKANTPQWTNVTRDNPCPICGKPDWCSLSEDGAVAICRRVESAVERTDTSGETYWVHHLEETDVEPLDYEPELADDDTLHAVYYTLLTNLTLSPEHRMNLQKRGLSDEEITNGMYRSLGLRGRSFVAGRLAEQFDQEVLAAVPGFRIKKGEGDRYYWTLAGSPGLLVPVLDRERRVVALKIRLDDVGDGDSRYRYLSSSHRGGVGPGRRVHVPLHDDEMPTEVVRVTEGELKADVTTALTGILTLGVPGVGAWRLALPVLHQLGAKLVRVAFDQDVRTNRRVACALENAVKALDGEGFEVELDTWK